MRAVLAAALTAAVLVALPGAQTTDGSARSGSLEQAFAAGGRIRMDLSAGEYRIAGTTDKVIRMRWSVREPAQLSRVRARADVSGTSATVRTDGPNNSNFRVTIEVPARTDLDVSLSAGELDIRGIEGNKDVSSHAGEIDIDVVNASQYRRVEASVWAGELHPGPFGRTKEGLFRSFDWNGNGPYRLAARLKAGELRLHAALSSTTDSR